MIFLAKETINSNNYHNLNFLLKDAQELDFMDEFDIVSSNAQLNWIKGYLQILEGIKLALNLQERFYFKWVEKEMQNLF